MVKYDTILSMTAHWDFDEFVEMLPQEGNLLEIGSFVGKSTVCWAKTFEKYQKNWSIHTVDAFAGIMSPAFYMPRKGGDLYDMTPSEKKGFLELMEPFNMDSKKQMAMFLENIEGWDNITWEKRWLGHTKQYVPPVKPTAMFYDGDHGYRGMKALFDSLGDTPYIFVDDCTPQFPQSIQVLEELNRPYSINEYGIGVIHEEFFTN